MTKTAAIIGGTGQIGLAAAARLARDGWRVRLLHRGERGIDPIDALDSGLDVSTGVLDRDDTDALLAATRGHDLVLDTVAYRPEHAEQLSTLGPDVGSLVVISTASVYLGRNGGYLDIATNAADFPDYPDPLTEDSPTVDNDAETYSPRKSAIERRLLATDLPVSILRPGAVHGRHSGMLREWYFIKRALDRRNRAVLAYDGASVFSTVAAANVAELIALCAARPARRVLNAADEEALTVRGIGETVFRLLGHDAEIVTFPGDPTPEEVGASPWALAHPLHLSMAAAKAELGYRQAVSYENSLEDDIRWALDAVAAAEARGFGWREAFPALVSRYGADAWFRYDAEDAFLSNRNLGTTRAPSG